MRRIAIAMVVGALVAGLSACTSDSGSDGSSTTAPASSASSAAETAGLIPKQDWLAQQDEFLAFATKQNPSPTDPLGLIAKGAAAERAGETPDLSAAKVADFQETFAKLEAFEDTGDFDVNRLITLWIRQHEHLDPKLAAAIKEHILGFKYWWTEPTPKGIVDSQYYWTENHQVIFLANEYIAGQTFPDETFTNSGMTGTEHMAHAAERLQKWFDWRARFGFSEWLRTCTGPRT